MVTTTIFPIILLERHPDGLCQPGIYPAHCSPGQTRVLRSSERFPEAIPGPLQYPETILSYLHNHTLRHYPDSIWM